MPRVKFYLTSNVRVVRGKVTSLLGKRLRNERKHTCRYGCCTWTNAHRVRKTKHERMRDNKAWKKDLCYT